MDITKKALFPMICKTNILCLLNLCLFNVELQENFCSWESTFIWCWAQFVSDSFKSLILMQNQLNLFSA